MIEIRPNCVQNIRQNLSRQRFGVYGGGSASPTEPVFKSVNGKQEVSDVLNFFVDSFNESAGTAGLTGKKNIFGRFYENLSQKIWLLLQKYCPLVRDTELEVVKQEDKILGCYSLSYNGSNSYINFLAVSPDIKDSKMTVKTLLNMALRISEKTKSKGLNTISWTTDKRNQKAYRLFDKFPANKYSNGADVDFFISVSDFDKTLNKYML